MRHLAKQRDASFFVLFFKTCQYGVLTEKRHVINAMDGLTTIEQRTYNAIQNVVIGLLDLGRSYPEIKALIKKAEPSN